MDLSQNPRVEELFHAAAEQPVSVRGNFLARACAGDAELRRDVEALLTADGVPDSFLDTPACQVALNMDAARTIKGGQRIATYTIVRLIGAGGMGNVYQAVQDQPRRTVALKLLRTSLASDAELQRFRYESELLGQLRHPNIAQVYEAGLHEEGPVRIPYFAMEYIADSSNLVEYARSAGLNTEQRLDLFIHVCQAVQYGHQKGIVHRDLKPGNILVDPLGAPKVIDYGVARAVDTEWPMTTMRASMDAFVGTLQYMSPEQLAGNNGDVDTRSDVYSLALVLFELLAGKRPYDVQGRRLSDAVRAIELLPCPTIASVAPDLRGDLSTIVAKAMEKDSARRYQSPGALAADIRRFLSRKPIEARPVSAFYRFRKFAERNKLLAASLLLAAIALVFGVAIAGWQFRNATIERDRARIEARKSERINAFLQNVLASADPRVSTADVTIRQALDRAAISIESELADEPRVYADVHATIGSIYERMNLHDQAVVHLRAALKMRKALFGEQSCEVANTLSDLAWSLGCSHLDEQDAAAKQALAIYRELYGDDHPRTVAQEVYLAGFMIASGHHDRAETLVKESLAKLHDKNQKVDDTTAYAMKVLAESLQGQRRMDEAERAYRNALAVHRQVYNAGDYELGLMLSATARFLAQRNKTKEAQMLQTEATIILENRVGKSSDQNLSQYPETDSE